MNTPKLTVSLCTAAGLLFSGCDKVIQAGGTSDETNSNISVSGRVFNEQSKPLGGVIVCMRRTNLADTTNGDGEFLIASSRTTLASALSGTVDTLDYLRNGSVVFSLAVPTWVAAMPDVFLVQRDLSGTLTNALPPRFGLSGILITTKGDSITFPFEWSADAKRYSGFAWSRFTGGLDTFRVQTLVQDSAGHLVGRSQKLTFTSLAGDVVIPSFDPLNLMPRLSILGPRTLYRLDTVRFRTVATDSLGSRFRYDWRLGDGSWGNGSSDTMVKLPNRAPDSLIVRVKAVRQDGLSVVDSLFATIKSFAPKVAVSFTDTLGFIGKPVGLHFVDSDTLGSKIIRRWIGSPWNREVSGKDTVLNVPRDVDSFSVTYWVQNDRGDSISSSSKLPTQIEPPEFSPNGGQFDSAETVVVKSPSKNVLILVRRRGDDNWIKLESDGKLTLQTSMTWEAKSERRTKESSITTSDSFEFPVVRGSITDSRDGKTYKTVKIGNRIWLAENMKWMPDSVLTEVLEVNSDSTDEIYVWKLVPDTVSWKCANEDCETFGRMYRKSVTTKVCPSGWSLPSNWREMIAEIGGESAGNKVKSKTEWDGTDQYGFNALPGDASNWHSAAYTGAYNGKYAPMYEGGVHIVDSRIMFYLGDPAWSVDSYKSVRCVKDSL